LQELRLVPTPPDLDIDLGKEKRRIVWPPFLPIWSYFVIGAVGFVLIGGGVGMIPFRSGEHAVTLIIILILCGCFFLLGAGGLAAVGWFFSGERLYVFTDGVCYERRGGRDCYRWKDIEKVVYYSNNPGVYWLYFKNGRKVSVSVLDGINKKDWNAVREYLERKIGDKFVDES
jgi:hypothetical protein